MKFEGRCRICRFEKKDSLHNDYLNKNMKPIELAHKYFPEKTDKIARQAVVRAIEKHFKNHYTVEQEVAALVVAETPAQYQNIKGAVVPTNEQRVYGEYIRQRLSAASALEEAVRNLMEKANFMEDEWMSIHAVTKCSVCGRDDNKETLGKLLAIFKEIREMTKALTAIRNPLEIFKKFFEQTFIIYTDRIMEIYMETLKEKGRTINQSINEYLRNEISPALLSRRVAELEDLGRVELERQIKEQFKKILQNARKEMDLSL